METQTALEERLYQTGEILEMPQASYQDTYKELSFKERAQLNKKLKYSNRA